MPDLTSAPHQAVFLRSLAEHLDAHPDLSRVDVDRSVVPPVWRLRPYRDEPAGLAAWCRSLGVTGVRATLLDTFASCWAGAKIDGHDVRLWAAVDGLQRLLVEDRSVGACISATDGLRLTVSDLEYFAEHGTLPEAGEPR